MNPTGRNPVKTISILTTMKTISKTISAAIMLAVCPVTPARADGVTSADVLRDSLPEHWELDRQ